MVALALLSAGLTIVFTGALSAVIATVFHADERSQPGFWLAGSLAVVGIAGALRAALLWFQEWAASLAAAAAKRQLRSALLDAISARGSVWHAARNTSDLTLLATTKLDALDPYFSRFLPQLVYTGLVTPLLTWVIFVNDFWSGVAIVATLPLIPLFMIFIGWATQKLQQEQLSALTGLARHFNELLRGLTTLRVFNRLGHQSEQIAASSEAFRSKTMKVLRMSFLSGLALEVAASLSVALVAVSIGIRLINGDLQLQVGLFVLLLAPEAYLPLRQVGANFHASNEGVAASVELLDIIAEAPAVADQQIDTSIFEAGTVSQIVGASGSGKTTKLNQLRASIGADEVAWHPQRVALLPGSVEMNIIGPNQPLDTRAFATAWRLAALDDLEPDRQVTADLVGLSGGQAQRVSLARAYYRALTKSTSWLILDEPISAQDGDRASTIAQGLQAMASMGLRVVVVSHQNLNLDTREFSVANV